MKQLRFKNIVYSQGLFIQKRITNIEGTVENIYAVLEWFVCENGIYLNHDIIIDAENTILQLNSAQSEMKYST